MKKAQILRNTSLFRPLDDDQLKSIVELAEEKVFENNEVIFRHGELAKNLYVLLEGTVTLKITAIEDLDPMAETLDQRGSVFGMAALTISHRYNVTAKCTRKTRALSLESGRLMAIVMQNQRTGLEVMAELAQLYLNRFNSARTAISNLLVISKAQNRSAGFGKYEELE